MQLIPVFPLSSEAKVNTTSDPHGIAVNSLSLQQAHGVRENSSDQCPNFFKQLLKSHLTGKFCLNLPKKFCDEHLPSNDDTIILVDEDELEYSMRYSARRNRFGSGWKGFCMAHKLRESDALVFHLIEPCKFKVYIKRASKSSDDDGASGLQNFSFQNSQPINTVKIEDQIEGNVQINATERAEYLSSSAVDNPQEKKKARLVYDSRPVMDQSQSVGDSDIFVPDVHEGVIKCSESVAYFKDVNGFEDFTIQVDGVILDSEIPLDLRIKYYELCVSQKMYLHESLIKGISSKLAAVMISETVNIADAAKSANLATSLHHLECWGKTLKAFEDLGMLVGFILDRLNKLVSLSLESQAVIQSKKMHMAQVDEEIRNLEATAVKAKAVIGRLEAELESLKSKIVKLGLEFQGLTGSPW
ncbi:hypothetical protein DM860_005236 [Cuscuta australis]|uniref:TF-B3 domain-containing protein n=1 Tax=Cuscuta australis TaxID=267555 RepID=A0A328E093_9ASTE|nr:hypothetical protein DM860_005236 [Cuscuta australis]